jgi:hypothetical protein
MPCFEYETLVRRMVYHRALVSSLESVNMHRHDSPARRAKDIPDEAQAMLIQLQNSIRWHKKACAACKQ